MKYLVITFAPEAVTFGPVSKPEGPFKTIEAATERARKQVRKQSLINGTSYATIKQFVPSASDYRETATIYASNGAITEEQIHEFPML